MEYNFVREKSHFKKVKTSYNVHLSAISTFTETCEISSATIFSECQPIPNQMTDVGCHKNDRSVTATGSGLEAGLGCRGVGEAALSLSGMTTPKFLNWGDGGGYFRN